MLHHDINCKALLQTSANAEDSPERILDRESLQCVLCTTALDGLPWQKRIE